LTDFDHFPKLNSMYRHYHTRTLLRHCKYMQALLLPNVILMFFMSIVFSGCETLETSGTWTNQILAEKAKHVSREHPL